MDLKQRKLFISKEFTLKENALHVIVKNLTSSQELEIPFEEINPKKLIKQSRTDNLMIALTAIVGLIFIINFFLKVGKDSDLSWGSILFMFVLSSAFGLISYLGRRDQILIPTVNNGLLEVLNGRPSKEATAKFVETLGERINSYLIKKYATIDKDLPIEPQLTQLMWLREREILKDDEFEKLKQQLIGRKDTAPIGFKN